VTIDRLVAVDLIPGEVRRQVVALRGACSGTMARLSHDDPVTGVELEVAQSCIDTPSTRSLVREAPVGDEVSVTDGDDCADSPAHQDVACIPSGWFLLGDRTAVSDYDISDPRRERVAHLDRFWLDRNEVTVERFRQAIREGMDPPKADALESNPYPVGKSSANNPYQQCTWIESDTPVTGDRGAYPTSCISWEAARAFCWFVHGDLPTEAQWEYVATAAGRDAEVSYPWGDSTPPTCEPSVVFGRMTPTQVQKDTFSDVWLRISDACLTEVTGPEPVDSERGSDDVTAPGVKGMGGNLSEWVLDAGYPYEHACWRSQRPLEPSCLDDNPPLRSVRGGSWAFGASWLAGAIRTLRTRGPQVHNQHTTYIGFRCAYDRPPPEPEARP
jgi:formylglycine-generating enzyme required for sulfatase activity